MFDLGPAVERTAPARRPWPKPGPHAAAIIRHCAAEGFIFESRAMNANGRWIVRYCYAGGDPVRNERGNPISPEQFKYFVTWLWLIPVEVEFTDGFEEPKRYRTRTLVDGELPLFVGERGAGH